MNRDHPQAELPFTSPALPLDPLSASTTAPTGPCLTPTRAAEFLGVGRTTVYGLIGSGVLPSVKIGRCRRIPLAALEAYVAGLMQDG